MKTISTVWTGIRPLVMHNARLCDPADSFVREIRAITAKGSKKLTDDDYLRRDKLEWQAGLYWDSDLGPIVPSDNIESTIRAGARKSRLGKDVEAVVFCSESVVKLEYPGPRDKEKLYASGDFVLRKSVVVQTSRLMRVRPMFPTGWKLSFSIDYDEAVISYEALVRAMIDAGSLCGLGDHRPKFGRFTVEVN